MFKKLLFLFLVLSVAGGAYWKFNGSSNSNPALDGEAVLQIAKRGPFRITATEKGTIESQHNATLVSNVKGSTTIISIVPEGTMVKKGEVVCELDSSSLVDKEQEQQIKLTQAEANVLKATEDVAIQLELNKSNVGTAQLNLELAELDLDKYKNGDSIQEMKELQSSITIAEEKLLQATDEYEFAKRLARKGYKTLNEVETARIAVSDATLEKEIAEGKLEVLDKYTVKRTLKELEEKVKETERELTRVKREGVASLAQFEAELKAKQLTFDVEKNTLKKLQDQIEACKLRAPQDGQVVYPSQSSRRNEGQAIEEGTSVRERQTIIQLPDLTKMKVDARIHESRISMLEEGLPVNVRVTSYPDEIFKGVVTYVSSVPLSSSWMTPNLKEYEAEIQIDDTPDKVKRLRPGLTAELEILVSQREDVLQIPVQSVISIFGKHYAYLIEPDSSEVVRREIFVGDTNGKMIEVKDGVPEMSQMIMNPRTMFADEITELEDLVASERRKKNEEALEQNGQQKPDANRPQGPKGNDKPRKKNPEGKKPSGRPSSGDMISRMDKDGDGKLSAEEVPQQMKNVFSMVDSNGDGFLDKTEMEAAASKMRRGGPQ